jgi:hypothetical protein
MIQSQKIVEAYAKQYQHAQDKLNELSEQSASFLEAVEAQRDARARIKAAQSRIDALEEQREALFSDFQRASFDGDEDRLREIADQRKDIESQIEAEDAKVEEAELDITANLIDSIASADWLSAWREAERNLPDFNNVLVELRRSLQEEETELKEGYNSVHHRMERVPKNKDYFEQHDPGEQRQRRVRAEQERAKKAQAEAKEERRIEALLQVLRHSDDALEAYKRGVLAGAGPVDPAILARV